MKPVAKIERTALRSLEFSDYHRKQLPHYCYCSDIDYVEFRTDRGPVALIETKFNEAPLTPFQFEVYRNLGNAANLPSFLVRYRFEKGGSMNPPHKFADGSDITWDKWNTWQFRVSAINSIAEKALNNRECGNKWLDGEAFKWFMKSL